jgi:hypothetical protein
MNEKRTVAFNEWWLLKAQPENRMTPSAIWDAACDWMKEELLWELERWTDEKGKE